MPSVTIAQPSVGLEAFFEFKDPVAQSLRSSMTIPATAAMLRVTSVVTVGELQATSGTDVYEAIYGPLGITLEAFKDDVAEDMIVLTLRYESAPGRTRFVRVPLRYVQSYSQVGDIAYIQKHLVLNLGYVPTGFDTTAVFTDLRDFVSTRLGVECTAREVALGSIVRLQQDEHDIRENIRQNRATVKQTMTVRLAYLEHAYSEVMSRLQTLGISLS